MEVFKFKYFDLINGENIMKPSTDSVILGAWASNMDYTRILDLGCGSGILSLMLAQQNQNCEVFGIDINLDAVELSNVNFINTGFVNSFNFIHTDFTGSSLPELFFDLIISNPPYFIEDLPSQLQSKNLQRHFTASKISLLASNVANRLSKDGLFLIVMPIGLESLWTTELIMKGLYPVEYLKIKHSEKSATSLVCVAYSRFSSFVNFAELVILNEKGDYSEAYKELTQNFIL
ncbi:MAG TPA: methyltransferase [Saprospiraceae bacterium]|nr:methyltransferase [Saprospiraceae bacterium]